jgi:hypothetical protein
MQRTEASITARQQMSRCAALRVSSTRGERLGFSAIPMGM